MFLLEKTKILSKKPFCCNARPLFRRNVIPAHNEHFCPRLRHLVCCFHHVEHLISVHQERTDPLIAHISFYNEVTCLSSEIELMFSLNQHLPELRNQVCMSLLSVSTLNPGLFSEFVFVKSSGFIAFSWTVVLTTKSKHIVFLKSNHVYLYSA